jgi:UDP:flavonoid glycosyltransferase YjiC (YdhE family)
VIDKAPLLGTRRAVQPFVALARGLLAAGHDVVVATPHRFAGFVAGLLSHQQTATMHRGARM